MDEIGKASDQLQLTPPTLGKKTWRALDLRAQSHQSRDFIATFGDCKFGLVAGSRKVVAFKRGLAITHIETDRSVLQ